MKLPTEVRKHLALIGAKGGSARSEAKTLACRANARLPRKKRKQKENP